MPDLENIDLATVEQSVFEPLVNSEFTLEFEDGSIPAVLTEVAPYPAHSPDGASEPARKPFGLVFKCESASIVPGSYSVSHPELPSCELFLSPFEGGADWCKLEAIFN